MSARYYLLFVLVVPLLLLAAEDKPRVKEEGFADLFNGKNLKGWVRVNSAPGTFFVKDGVLITTGVPTGFLRTDKMYENFIFELEWRHMKAKGNSGVFVWADPLPAVGSQFTRAVEVQVLDGLETENYTSHGDIFSIHGAKFTPDRKHPAGWARCLPSEKRCKPSPQWNHYRIECNDGVIKLAVNGKVVSGGTSARPRKGYITLEAEGSECQFRHLKIKELPTTNPSKEEICDEGKEFETLFTGIALAGWDAGAAHKAHWKAQGGPNILRFDGKAEKPEILNSKKAYKAFELICDFKLPREGKGHLIAADVRVNLEEGVPVRFNRLVIRREAKGHEVRLNGKVIEAEKRTGDLTEGPIGLAPKSEAEFTNIFIRDLK
jgi:hypothetical protein